MGTARSQVGSPGASQPRPPGRQTTKGAGLCGCLGGREGGAPGPSQIPRRARGFPLLLGCARTHLSSHLGSGQVPVLPQTRKSLDCCPLSPPRPDPELSPGVMAGAKGLQSCGLCFYPDTDPTSRPDDLGATGAGRTCTPAHTIRRPASRSHAQTQTPSDHADQGQTCRART